MLTSQQIGRCCMPERGGRQAFKILMTLLCFSVAAFIVWLILADWIARPNAEATPSQYLDASNAAEGESYNSGKCPALAMAVAKALSDKRLTAREVHDLDNQAEEMAEAYDIAFSKNTALRQVGQTPDVEEVDCSRGRELFGY